MVRRRVAAAVEEAAGLEAAAAVQGVGGADRRAVEAAEGAAQAAQLLVIQESPVDAQGRLGLCREEEGARE